MSYWQRPFHDVVLMCVRAAQNSTRSLHLGATYDTGMAFAASLRVTEGQYIVVDQMPIQVIVRINNDDRSTISSGKLADIGSWGSPRRLVGSSHEPGRVDDTGGA